MFYFESYDFRLPTSSPHWDESTSPDALQQTEKDSFLEWRRELAQYVIVNKLTLFFFIVTCLFSQKMCIITQEQHL